MKKSSLPKKKKGAWFVPVRGSYLPASPTGIGIYLVFVAFLVFTMFDIENHAATFREGVYTIFPLWICAALVMHWIAARKS